MVMAWRRRVGLALDCLERGRMVSDAAPDPARRSRGDIAGKRSQTAAANVWTARGMILCDLSTFYCGKGGGVSTYHRARLEWFARQHEHQYVLISPGPRFEMRQIAK